MEFNELKKKPAKKAKPSLLKSVNKAKNPAYSRKKSITKVSNASALDIDNFLVDEQFFVYKQIQSIAESGAPAPLASSPAVDSAIIKASQNQPVQLKKALDRLWQAGHYSISLNRQGNLAKLQDKTASKSSAFTLNLKKCTLSFYSFPSNLYF